MSFFKGLTPIQKALFVKHFGFFELVDSERVVEYLELIGGEALPMYVASLVKNNDHQHFEFISTEKAYDLLVEHGTSLVSQYNKIEVDAVLQYCTITTDYCGLIDRFIKLSNPMFSVPHNDEIVHKLISILKDKNPSWFDGNNLVDDGLNSPIALQCALYYDNWKQVSTSSGQHSYSLLLSMDRMEELISSVGIHGVLSVFFNDYYFDGVYSDGSANDNTIDTTTFYLLDNPNDLSFKTVTTALPSYVYDLSSDEKIINEVVIKHLVYVIHSRYGGDFSSMSEDNVVSLLKRIGSSKTYEWRTMIIISGLIKRLGITKTEATMSAKWFKAFIGAVITLYSDSYIVRYASAHSSINNMSEEELASRYDEIPLMDGLEFLVASDIVPLETILDILKSLCRSTTFFEFINAFSERYPTISYMIDVNKMM